MQVASKDSTAVITVHTYMFVGTMYSSEDTCKTMLLHVRVSSDDQYCHTTLNKIYAYVRTCTEVCIEWQTICKTYKDIMMDRTKMVKDRAGSTEQLWHVLQMVQCRLLSEVSLTSVLPRSITVSSLVGCESVCEGNRQGQRKGTYHYMRFTPQEVTTHCSMWTERHRARGEGGYRMLEWLVQVGGACIQWVIPKTDYTEQYKYFK